MDAVVRVRVGLVSDTHGLLGPEAVAFLRNSDLIVHAGDICDASVLRALEEIAPTIAVKGNNDHGGWADNLGHAETVDAGGVLIHVTHDIADLAIDPYAQSVRVVVTGHSHKPSAEQRGCVLFINPGSAGPRRFRLPISIAELLIQDGVVSHRHVNLDAPPTQV